MDEPTFDVVFQYRDKALRSHPELEMGDLKNLMVQDEKIRRLVEVIEGTPLKYKPILYSRS